MDLLVPSDPHLWDGSMSGSLTGREFEKFDSNGYVKVAVMTGGAGGSSAIPAATSTISQIAPSTTSQSVLAANSARLGVILQNNSSQPVRIAYAASASGTQFTLLMAPNGSVYAMPQPVFVGQISAVWDSSASGALQVTELLP